MPSLFSKETLLKGRAASSRLSGGLPEVDLMYRRLFFVEPGVFEGRPLQTIEARLRIVAGQVARVRIPEGADSEFWGSERGQRVLSRVNDRLSDPVEARSGKNLVK